MVPLDSPADTVPEAGPSESTQPSEDMPALAVTDIVSPGSSSPDAQGGPDNLGDTVETVPTLGPDVSSRYMPQYYFHVCTMIQVFLLLLHRL